MRAVRAFFDFLAKMGLSIRDDPPKTIELSGRAWGPPTDGLMLSVAAADNVISVLLRNVGPEQRQFNVPEFSQWFRLTVEDAESTPFGVKMGAAGAGKPLRRVDLASGSVLEAQIPIAALYRLHSDRLYEVRATCEISAGTIVVSNAATFSKKS